MTLLCGRRPDLLQSLYKIKYPRLIYNFEELDKQRKEGGFVTIPAYLRQNAISKEFSEAAKRGRITPIGSLMRGRFCDEAVYLAAAATKATAMLTKYASNQRFA